MSRLHVNHIEARLQALFRGKIDTADARTTDEVDAYFRTRAYAAYTLLVLTGIDADTAASSVTDGHGDGGLDAVYFDQQTKALWLLQSKWIQDGHGEPEQGDLLKFTAGVKKLIEFDIDGFNEKVKAKRADINAALQDAQVKIQLVLTYTGQKQTEANKRIIDDFVNEMNDPSELVELHVMPLDAAHKALEGSLEGGSIQLDVPLLEWGRIETPFDTVYGQVSAKDVASWWQAHRVRLFSANIRRFIGSTEANQGMIKTLVSEPDNFVYFNNGISVVCTRLEKRPIGGPDRAVGIFQCSGASIVNGAQTVGSIGNAYDRSPETVERARVMIRLISLERFPEGLAVRLTRATNTQNRIEKQDFVSLDPQQHRMKTELALEGITYHFVRSDEMVTCDEKNITLEEATVALACADAKVDLAVQAKREIGKLWEDTSKEPYTSLFNERLTATKLRRAVLVLRDVESYLRPLAAQSIYRKRSFYVHANRFLTHIMLRVVPQELLHAPGQDFEAYRSNAFAPLLEHYADQSLAILERDHPQSLVHQVYRNLTKCRNMAEQLLPALTVQTR